MMRLGSAALAAVLVAVVSGSTLAADRIEWRQRADGPLARMEATGLAVGDRIYVFGGYSDWPRATTRADVYEPATDSWTRLADMPEAVTHVQPVSDGERIYFAGGFLGAFPSPSTGRLWVYDIADDRWSRGPDLPEPLGAGAAVLVDGRLYFFGGTVRLVEPSSYDDRPAAYVLDLDGGAEWAPLEPLPTPRNHFTAATDGKRIFLFGGQRGGDEGNANLDVVEAYDIRAGTWSTVAPMPVRKGHTAALTHAGALYVIGGSVDDGRNGAASDTIVRYDPQADRWETLTPLPAAMKTPVIGFVGDRLYVTAARTTGPGRSTYEGSLVAGE